MMRYDNAPDWVEIKPGISKRPMREFIALDADMDQGHAWAIRFTKDASFTDADGNPADWKGSVFNLSMRQWSWWKDQLLQAARDDAVDPEA